MGRGVPGQGEIVHRCDHSYGWGRPLPLLAEFLLVLPRLVARELYGGRGFDPAADLSVKFIPRTVFAGTTKTQRVRYFALSALLCCRAGILGLLLMLLLGACEAGFPLSSAAAYDCGDCRVSSGLSCKRPHSLLHILCVCVAFFWGPTDSIRSKHISPPSYQYAPFYFPRI